MSSDEAIQLTNNDATNSKAYAISKGYWQDPYMQYFAPSFFKQQPQQPIEHKPPEMSRGYFARVNAIRTVVNKFLSKYAKTNQLNTCQIVNLGCGYDTLYFDLCDMNLLPRKYVEIDFPRIVMSKIRIIKSKKALSDKLANKVEKTIPPVETQTASNTEFTQPFLIPSLPAPIPGSNNEISTENYHLINCDLRNTTELERKLKNDCKLDFSLPTLFITECVLVYMQNEHSNKLLSYLSENFKLCSFVSYEQVNLDDKFGEIMLANMELRSCKLLGIEACHSIDSQLNRFINNGFSLNACQVITMTDYYKNKMSQRERERIEAIEFLDENELLFQLMDHYCVCIAANNTDLKDILF